MVLEGIIEDISTLLRRGHFHIATTWKFPLFLAFVKTSAEYFLLVPKLQSEAPRAKARGNLLRRSSLGYAGQVFAEPSDVSRRSYPSEGGSQERHFYPP